MDAFNETTRRRPMMLKSRVDGHNKHIVQISNIAGNVIRIRRRTHHRIIVSARALFRSNYRDQPATQQKNENKSCTNVHELKGLILV